MPAVFIFDEGHALALDGLGDDHHRLFLDLHGLFIGRQDLRQGMAVHRQGLPAEGRHPGHVGLDVPAIHGFTALAQAVDVGDAHQVVELVMGGDLQGLPHRTLGHFAVAQEHVGAVGQHVQVPGIHGQAHAHGQPLAERAGGRLHVGESHGGVAFQRAAELAVVSLQILPGDFPGGHPQGIKQRGGVALGKNQAVVVGEMGPVRVIAENAPEKEGGHELHGGQGRSGVAGAGRGGGGEDVMANKTGKFFQAGEVGWGRHGPGPPYVWVGVHVRLGKEAGFRLIIMPLADESSTAGKVFLRESPVSISGRRPGGSVPQPLREGKGK